MKVSSEIYPLAKTGGLADVSAALPKALTRLGVDIRVVVPGYPRRARRRRARATMKFMKFAMNGAITIGTLDGANFEIRDAVGHDNFFWFGLTAEEVERRKAEECTPRSIYESSPKLRKALDLISSWFFSDGDRGLFQPLVDSLLTRDDYMLLVDYQAYVECQERVSRAYADRNAWTRMSILKCARAGRFSSDRSIREYCRDIWTVAPIVFDQRRAGCRP